jgi:transposase
MIAIDRPVRFLNFTLASKGPSTHDANDDAEGTFRCIEILMGPSRRLRWSAEDKARIVAETLLPGARVSEVARRWQVCSQQAFGWRRAARRDMRTAPATTAAPVSSGFVPIITEADPVTPVPHMATSVIEVRVAVAVVRIPSGVDDAAQLTAVLQAIRASASRT